jgi:molybdate transport system regulatory protein
MTRLTLRIDFGAETAIGPGKTRLLELVGETGSIAAAGRAMGMSYRRAWLLVEALNGMFTEPLVATRLGGRAGGGAGLTPFGEHVVERYRAMERLAETTLRPHLAELEQALKRPKE